MPRVYLNDFKGLLTDVGYGKAPLNTFSDLKNVRRDIKVGSLVTRGGYGTSSLTAPTNSISDALNFPITYPSQQDINIWFGNSKVYQRPYFHTNDTVVDDWVYVGESTTLASVPSFMFVGNILQISYGTGFTGSTLKAADYYKNWIIEVKTTAGTFVNSYFVTASTWVSTSGGYETYTLNYMTDLNTYLNGIGTTHIVTIKRYLHSNFNTVLTYTNPHGYSTNVAVRWSGGKGSGSTLQNTWSGYLDKTFFQNTSSGYSYKGTYIDYAEIKAPVSSLFTSLASESIITTSGGSVISNQSNDAYFTGTSETWANGGGTATQSNTLTNYTWTTSEKIRIGGVVEFEEISHTLPALKLSSTGAGVAASDTNTLTTIASPTAGCFLASTSYTLQFGYILKRKSDVYTLPTFKIIAGDIENSFDLTFSDAPLGASVTFLTYGSITAHNIRMYFTAALTGVDFYLTDINVISSLSYVSTGKGLVDNKTYRAYLCAEYDGFQDSELTYLSNIYIKNTGQKITTTFTIPFAELNKRITAYKIYLAIDDKNTTSTITTTNPKYLVKTIYISGTSANVFSLTGNNYSLSILLNQDDIDQSVYTWEQKTGRVASTSTTCSYDIARMISGRVFLAQDYDYTDAKTSTNRLRYSGFNGDGVMCPDIFPNIYEYGIIEAVSGSGNNINNLIEFNGNCVILKDNSIVVLNSGDQKELWRFDVVSDVIGGLGKNSSLKIDKGLVFAGQKDIYLWNGGGLNTLAQGIWKSTYGALINTTYKDKCFLWFSNIDGHLYIAPNTTSYPSKIYSFLLPDTMPQEVGYADNFKNYFKKSDGSVVGVLSTGVSYMFSSSNYDRSATDIAITAQTNYIMPDNKSNIVISEIFADVELSSTATAPFSLYSNDTNGAANLIQTVNITGSTTRRHWRFPIAPHSPVKAISLKLEMATYSVIQNIGFDYEIQLEGGDVAYTA